MAGRRLKRIDILWLVLALLLHSTLLLVQVDEPSESSEKRHSISVSMDIQAQEDPEPAQPEPYLSPPDLTPPDQPLPDQPPPDRSPVNSDKPPPTPVAEAPREAEPLQPQQPIAEKPSTPKTAAHLLLDASEFQFAVPESDQARELGVYEKSPLPPNWKPSLKLENNMFTGRTGSGKTEIVDQWQSADGAYNVVVKTPSGKTLCGHTQPRTRIGSMEEPVVMWRICD